MVYTVFKVSEISTIFLYFVLISLYVVFFGLNSFKRYKEESIIVIKKNLDIASTDINIRPGLVNISMKTENTATLYMICRHGNPSHRSH